MDGQLYLGMMWRSRKALDLIRDSRCVVHSTVSDRLGSEGEFKVYGRAAEVKDLDERKRFGDAVFEAIGYRPEEPEFHCFSRLASRVWRSPGWRATRWCTGCGGRGRVRSSFILP